MPWWYVKYLILCFLLFLVFKLLKCYLQVNYVKLCIVFCYLRYNFSWYHCHQWKNCNQLAVITMNLLLHLHQWNNNGLTCVHSCTYTYTSLRNRFILYNSFMTFVIFYSEVGDRYRENPARCSSHGWVLQRWLPLWYQCKPYGNLSREHKYCDSIDNEKKKWTKNSNKISIIILYNFHNYYIVIPCFPCY